MPVNPDHMHGHGGLLADPYYLSALASLGGGLGDGPVAAPARHGVAVLPFVNLSGDAGQEYFTDGLTEDIITDLSNVPGLLVIARNSTFAYKNKPTDVRQIARDLGVGYVLEGSARRAGERLRVNVQLIAAAEGGTHVFAERFDRDYADIFSVQDEISRRVVEVISDKLANNPVPERYRTTSLEAYDLYIRSRHLFVRSKGAAETSRNDLEKALALDPHYAEVHSELSQVHWFSWQNYGGDKDVLQAAALKHGRLGVQFDPGNSSAHAALAVVLMFNLDWAEAGHEFDTAVRLNENDTDALSRCADYKGRIGKPEESLTLLRRAFRLNPSPPSWYFWDLGDAQIQLGHFTDAVKTLDRAEIRQSAGRRTLAAALALAGRIEEAKAEASAFLTEYPGWTITSWLENSVCVDRNINNTHVRGYRLAGLPE